MCLRTNLNQTDLDKLEKLVADKSLNINATLKVSGAAESKCWATAAAAAAEATAAAAADEASRH